MNINELGKTALRICNINLELSNKNITKQELAKLYLEVLNISNMLLDALDDLDENGDEYHIACCMYDNTNYLTFRIYDMIQLKKRG